MKEAIAQHWPWLLAWAGTMNVLSLCLMWDDKRRARAGVLRVREVAFFLFALLGGAPGAIMGMHLFHHKTRHWYFKWGLPAILLLQIALLWLVFNPVPGW